MLLSNCLLIFSKIALELYRICAKKSKKDSLLKSFLGDALFRTLVDHLQYVNAHHSKLKGWINNWFRDVASKYFNRYAGWRQASSTCELTFSRLIEKLAGGWLYQLEL